MRLLWGTDITKTEAYNRYTNLKNFYIEYGHYWVGAGPYILTNVNLNGKTATLVMNPYYLDPPTKWESFIP